MPYPHITFNWLAMIVSVFAAFFLSYIWYDPLFGKIWAKAMGLKIGKATSKEMTRGLVLQFIGTCLTTFVLAHTVQIWRPSVWGVGEDSCSCMYGFLNGFFTWIGFYIPLQLNKISWEGKPWKLFFINVSHDFLSLQIISMILAYWR